MRQFPNRSLGLVPKVGKYRSLILRPFVGLDRRSPIVPLQSNGLLACTWRIILTAGTCHFPFNVEAHRLELT